MSITQQDMIDIIGLDGLEAFQAGRQFETAIESLRRGILNQMFEVAISDTYMTMYRVDFEPMLEDPVGIFEMLNHTHRTQYPKTDPDWVETFLFHPEEYNGARFASVVLASSSRSSPCPASRRILIGTTAQRGAIGDWFRVELNNKSGLIVGRELMYRQFAKVVDQSSGGVALMLRPMTYQGAEPENAERIALRQELTQAHKRGVRINDHKEIRDILIVFIFTPEIFFRDEADAVNFRMNWPDICL